MTVMPEAEGAMEGAAVIEAELAAVFGERFSTNVSIREAHANALTWHPSLVPDGVVFAETTQDVQRLVRLCSENGVPIIPYGAGTSLEGHVNAPHGGISLDMSRMNAIKGIRPEDLDCSVEPGVTRRQLNEHLRDIGLFFPIGPGAVASIGGMAATRASGTNAVRYGPMPDNVIALEPVMADGRVIRTARRARKTAAGYDLTRLLVGSEGTLGIITEITLKLHGIPEAIAGGICAFPSVEAACNTTIATIQAGVPVARIELLDAMQIRASNLHSNLGLPERPHLFVEFHGSPAGVEEQTRLFQELAEDEDGSDFGWATLAEERSRLWQARHDAYWAGFTLRPGAKALATDVCVPISRLAECVRETQADMAEERFVGAVLGHVGDGNFHVTLLVDMDDREEVARVNAFLGRLALRAIDMDGTCTGEHGIGHGKIKYLEAELGPALDAMRAVKRALDPRGILNPGKIIAL